jgi:hypothetical protein
MAVRFRPLALSFMAAALIALPESGSAEPVSEAEQMAFLDNHLANVTQSESLEFQFKRMGGVETPYEDHVAMSIYLGGQSGSKSVEADYLSGDRHVDLPRIDDAHGNPVVMYFLEADIRDMSRRTGGSSAYFRKRIRLALAQAAEVRPVHFEFAGTDVAGTEIRIRPYHDDPMRARLKNLEEKMYILTLAAQVPGGVYQLHTVAPGADGTAPALEDLLTFTGVKPIRAIAPEVR